MSYYQCHVCGLAYLGPQALEAHTYTFPADTHRRVTADEARRLVLEIDRRAAAEARR